MTRPRSIRLFELFWLGSLALTLVGTALLWPVLLEQAAAQAGAARLGPGVLNAIAGAGVAFLAAIELLLWYFVARRGSTVAKWLAVLFTAYGAYVLVVAEDVAVALATVTGVISAVALLMQVIATGALFAPDARSWFSPPAEESL